MMLQFHPFFLWLLRILKSVSSFLPFASFAPLR
jgi:hypothetical protein